MVYESDKSKVVAVNGVKRVFINFFPPGTKQHLLITFGQAMASPQTQGQDPCLRPTLRASGGQQHSTYSSYRKRAHRTPQPARHRADPQQRPLRGQRASCVGSRGVGDKGEGRRAAWWAAGHFWARRGRGERRKGRKLGSRSMPRGG